MVGRRREPFSSCLLWDSPGAPLVLQTEHEQRCHGSQNAKGEEPPLVASGALLHRAHDDGQIEPADAAAGVAGT